MWYLRKVVTLYEKFGPVSICLCPNYIKLYFQNFGNGRQNKNGHR